MIGSMMAQRDGQSVSVAGRIFNVIVVFQWRYAHLTRWGHFGSVGMVGHAGAASQLKAPCRRGKYDQGQDNGNAAGNEWGAGEVMPRGRGAGVVGKDLRSAERSDDRGQRAGRVDRALQFALAVVGHLPRQHAIDRRWGETADTTHGDEKIELVDVGRKGDARKGDCRCQKPDHAHDWLAHALGQWAGQNRLAEGKTDAECAQRAADR